MRISDWSSDVCSSDLVVSLHVTQPFAATIGFDGMAAAYAITDEDYEKASAEQAEKYLKQILDRADTAGVKAQSRAVSNFNVADGIVQARSEEHTSELQSLMRISYAVFCLKKKKTKTK